MELSPLSAWLPLLQDELDKPYFSALCKKVDEAYEVSTVYPPKHQLFAAFAATPPEAVRVVILGQDPYHEAHQANGLAFSVSAGVKLPPSLQNIYKERQTDLGIPPSLSGDLLPWARQGVLLLNATLTVAEGRPASHQSFGWQRFTDAVVQKLSSLSQPVAWVLWGAHAQKKAAAAKNSPYPRLILSSAHPSPLSAYRGFFGSRPFSQINTFLSTHGETEIDWRTETPENVKKECEEIL